MGGTRDTRLLAVLVGVTLVVAIISSLGAPLVPSLAESLSVPIPSAQWSLTVALLAGTIAAPVLGRLGDGPRRRETMVMVLGLVLVGGVAAWQADSLGVLIAGRAVQGVGLGLAPVAMAAARAHLPAERSSATIALLSVTGAAGVGAGYPISGLIASRFDVHDAFLFGALLSGAAAVAVLMVVPSSGSAAGAPLDTRGALALAVGLVATLLGIDQGGAQGWSSPLTLGLLLFGAVVIGLWARLQLATRYPLVDLRQLRLRAVAGADVATLLLGVALYTFLSVITVFVQAADAGFGASPLVAGLCLVPFSVTSLAASRASEAVIHRVGARLVLFTGSLVISSAGVFFSLAHSRLWHAFATMALVGIGFGGTFAAIPGVIARAVPSHETGSALGFYQVVRSIGYSLGSALTASILASHLDLGEPNESGFVLAVLVGSAVCLVAAASCAIVPAPARTAEVTAELKHRLRDDAELASAGLIDNELVTGARTRDARDRE